MDSIRPKKRLGQHFLKDKNIAKKIVERLNFNNYDRVIEIGPGKGMLTQFFSQKKTFYLIEIDKEAVDYLKKKFKYLSKRIIYGDFLKIDLSIIINKKPIAIIGNFPFNISTQILFKLLEYKEYIPFLCGMFQKEVAERVCEKCGSKKYGIISVLIQTFYEPSFVLDVPPKLFNPIPKVNSKVIELRRKENITLPCEEKLFFKVVKLSFQQRRKTIRNSLKSLQLGKDITDASIFDLRPEKLSNNDFIKLTEIIQNEKISNK